MNKMNHAENCIMARRILGAGLAVATLVSCIVNATGNVALVTKVGPTPVLSLAAMALAAAAFAVS